MEDKAFKQPLNTEPPQLKVLEVQENNEIVCHHCGSSSYKKAGYSRHKKPNYRCQNCKRYFVYNPKHKKLQTTEIFDFDSDVWSAEQLGLEAPLHRNERLINFSKIHQPWLKDIAKKLIYYCSVDRTMTTLRCYVYYLGTFFDFLLENHHIGQLESISRSTIIDYLLYLNKKFKHPTSKRNRISILKTLFQVGTENAWFCIEPYLIRPEDYPKQAQSIPRYIPEEVIQQLNQHLDALPNTVMRMVLVIQECGLRIGELCSLRFDCLKQDSKGKYYIQYDMWKMKKEHTKPVSVELAKVILEQQKYIQENLEYDFKYLFCSRKQGDTSGEFKPCKRVMSDESFINYLKRLAERFDIKEKSGKRWNFQSHQFRHTVGTRMINSGVPQHIVQRYLGHESPTMTMTYAHIHDETLRKEIEKYHETRVVNFQGETAKLEETVLASGDDLEWFKKTVQARALEHGYCSRPKLLGDCDIPGFDGCYGCPHWRTNKNFLPVLKDTLQRTENVLNKAQNCGWELQVKKNEPIKLNLEKVIKSLEEAS